MYSKEYITQLQSLHGDRARPQGFGGKTKKLGKFYDFMEIWKPRTLLDYGCGKGVILADLKDRYPNTICDGYDPAVSMFNNKKFNTFECVFSNDVLEHIEPEYLDDVLSNINELSSKYVWLRIDTAPARKTLPDGRNAHLIQESQEWWSKKISNFITGNIVHNILDKKGKLDVAIEK